VDEPETEELEWGEGRPLSLGWPEPDGSIGITRRIELLGEIQPFHGTRVLDLGCGNGSYSVRLAEHFDEVVGVEIEPERLGQFRDRLERHPQAERFELRLQSGERLSDPDDHYDAAFAIEVLEHIVHLDVAVAEVARVLRPGGVFYITVPNRWFPVETHSFMIRGRERESKLVPFVPWIRPLHRRISTARNFRPADLRRLLSPLGFTELGTTFLMPPLERWAPGRHLRSPVAAMGQTPLRHLGVSVVTAYRMGDGVAPV